MACKVPKLICDYIMTHKVHELNVIMWYHPDEDVNYEWKMKKWKESYVFFGPCIEIKCYIKCLQTSYMQVVGDSSSMAGF